MILNTRSHSEINSGAILHIRCPACRTLGAFDAITNDLNLALVDGGTAFVGHRRCPNPACHAHMFVAYDLGPTGPMILVTYPPETIDFDATNVPTSVVTALEEAIKCHANQCFTAAAVMVRKTLEELCADRGAEGDNLKERIKALGNVVLLPQELLDGLDDLRLLGNDAAHIESNVYDKIGKEEVEVGIEFTKEVLKAVYQYSALLQRLRGLKAQQADSAP